MSDFTETDSGRFHSTTIEVADVGVGGSEFSVSGSVSTDPVVDEIPLVDPDFPYSADIRPPDYGGVGDELNSYLGVLEDLDLLAQLVASDYPLPPRGFDLGVEDPSILGSGEASRGGFDFAESYTFEKPVVPVLPESAAVPDWLPDDIENEVHTRDEVLDLMPDLEFSIQATTRPEGFFREFVDFNHAEPRVKITLPPTEFIEFHELEFPDGNPLLELPVVVIEDVEITEPSPDGDHLPPSSVGELSDVAVEVTLEEVTGDAGVTIPEVALSMEGPLGVSDRMGYDIPAGGSVTETFRFSPDFSRVEPGDEIVAVARVTDTGDFDLDVDRESVRLSVGVPDIPDAVQQLMDDLGISQDLAEQLVDVGVETVSDLRDAIERGEMRVIDGVFGGADEVQPIADDIGADIPDDLIEPPSEGLVITGVRPSTTSPRPDSIFTVEVDVLNDTDEAQTDSRITVGDDTLTPWLSAGEELTMTFRPSIPSPGDSGEIEVSTPDDSDTFRLSTESGGSTGRLPSELDELRTSIDLPRPNEISIPTPDVPPQPVNSVAVPVTFVNESESAVMDTVSLGDYYTRDVRIEPDSSVTVPMYASLPEINGSVVETISSSGDRYEITIDSPPVELDVGSPELEPSVPAVGSEYSVSLPVANVGTVPADVDVLIDGDSAEGPDTLPPGEGGVYSIGLSADGVSGDHTLRVVHSNTEEVLYEEGVLVEYETPEFEIGEINTPPAPVNPFDEITIGVEVLNISNVPGDVAVGLAGEVVDERLEVGPNSPRTASSRIEVPSDTVDYTIRVENVLTGDFIIDETVTVGVEEPTPEFNVSDIRLPTGVEDGFGEVTIVVNNSSAHPGGVTVEVADELVASNETISPRDQEEFTARLDAEVFSSPRDVVVTNETTDEVVYEQRMGLTRDADSDESGGSGGYDGPLTYADPLGLFGTTRNLPTVDDLFGR